MAKNEQSYRQIECVDALDLLRQSSALLLDIRDEASFAQQHPKEAISLGSFDLDRFIDETDKRQPVMVICYHGISSQGAAQFLAQKGFLEVYSVIGGFEAWSAAGFPVDK